MNGLIGFMQILEASLLGLRAARIAFSNGETGQTVTLFPMIHAAEPEFYKAVVEDAFDAHDIALTEGISSPVTRRITRSYRWMVRGGGPLVLQSGFMTEAGRALRVRADLEPDEFDRLWATLPFATRLTITLAAPLVGLSLRLRPDLATLARRLEMDDLPSRDAVLGWSPETAPLDGVILQARDLRLVETLTRTIADAKDAERIAVVYGAAHMPAVLRALPDLGFAWTASDWMLVFRT